MSRVDQSIDELTKHLREQVEFLRSSCSAFDSGRFPEAKRIATTIRVLLHDTTRSESLLYQLGAKSTLRFCNTAIPHNPDNLLPHHGLVGFRMSADGASYKAPLGNGPTERYQQSPMDFVTWWNDLVIQDNLGNHFSRKDLVLEVANTDGGAHIDAALDANYASLTRDNSLGWISSDGRTERPLTDIELHSIRQVAYELLETLHKANLVAA